MIVSAHGHLFTSLFFFGFIALSLGLTWWSMRRARYGLPASLSPVGASRDGKMAWPYPVITCPQPHSWESQASFHSSVMTVCCTRSALSSAG